MVHAQTRAAHPVMNELLGGVDLASVRGDGKGALAKMLSNAEYWLSFDVAGFEPLLAMCPSPLRELGVAVALRFSDRIGGELCETDLLAAKVALLEDADEKLKKGLSEGLEALLRAVRARDRIPELEAQGYQSHTPSAGMSVHTLRAMGKAVIKVEGHKDGERIEVRVGEPVTLSALDDRGRPIEPPEVENRLGAPVLLRDSPESRSIVFVIPGEYLLRVPGKATGDRKLSAT